MKRSTLYKAAICIVLLVGAIPLSCERNLDLTNPSYQTVDSYYQNISELEAGTNAIYSMFHSASLVAREWFFIHDLRSDEVAAGGGQLEAARRQMLIGATTPSNAIMNSVWNGLYAVIHRANVVIENAPNVEGNIALRDRLVGEAKFFRGWAYFELVAMWGPVPLYTTPVKNPTDYEPRAPADSVYNQVFQDLKDAAAVLPATYNSSNQGRVTSGAANAMLGRAYMQHLEFDKAMTYLQKVINSPANYRLLDNYYDNFKEETEFNDEQIFTAVFFDKGDDSFNWGYVGNGPNSAQSTVRNQEYCPVAWRNLIPSDKYLNNFEMTATGAAKTDPRLAMSVYRTGDTFNGGQNTLTADAQNGNSSTINGKTVKASWRKYMLLYKQSLEEATGTHPGGNNQRIIRYAEILINMAECIIETNPSNISGALSYLNQVRSRPSVDMPPYPTAQYPANNKMDVIKIIMHEKMAELGDEQMRNLDIKRWRKQGYYDQFGGDPLGGEGSDPLPYFQEGRDELLPIPSAEVNNNPELGSGEIPAQNPGY